jgi:hypothetical protein
LNWFSAHANSRSVTLPLTCCRNASTLATLTSSANDAFDCHANKNDCNAKFENECI